MKIKIRYCGSPELQSTTAGDWIDLYTSRDVDLNAGEFTRIPLGVAMELPKGIEANIVPRSSTFERYGLLQTNSYGIVDNAYCGDTDEWQMPVYATRATFVPKGTRLCQFRLNPTMSKVFGEIAFESVITLGNVARGGFGSTGK